MVCVFVTYKYAVSSKIIIVLKYAYVMIYPAKVVSVMFHKNHTWLLQANGKSARCLTQDHAVQFKFFKVFV